MQLEVPENSNIYTHIYAQMDAKCFDRSVYFRFFISYSPLYFKASHPIVLHISILNISSFHRYISSLSPCPILPLHLPPFPLPQGPHPLDSKVGQLSVRLPRFEKYLAASKRFVHFPHTYFADLSGLAVPHGFAQAALSSVRDGYG